MTYSAFSIESTVSICSSFKLSINITISIAHNII
jgi:hypothetical protein